MNALRAATPRDTAPKLWTSFMHPRVSLLWVEERPQGPTPTKMIASGGGICDTLLVL